MAIGFEQTSFGLVLDQVLDHRASPGWSDSVKGLWDEDTRARRPLKVVVLGAAPLLIQRGLSESLTGRFEVLRLPHWSFAEMRAAFGVSLEAFLYFGGYPGAAALVKEPERWTRYILDSLIETTIARDVVLLTRLDKPALLRRLFDLGCRYSGQVLSYTKMRCSRHRGGFPSMRRGPIASTGAGWWNRPWAPISPTLRRPESARSSTGATATVRWTSWRTLRVGGDGIALEDFLSRPVEHWVKA